MCRINGKNKQNINILFLLLMLSLCGPLTLWIYPLKWKKNYKTAPFQLSFPQAILGSLFQTTSEKDFVFSCSPCLHWLGKAVWGYLACQARAMAPHACPPVQQQDPIPTSEAGLEQGAPHRIHAGNEWLWDLFARSCCPPGFSRQWVLEINSLGGALDESVTSGQVIISESRNSCLNVCFHPAYLSSYLSNPVCVPAQMGSAVHILSSLRMENNKSHRSRN